VRVTSAGASKPRRASFAFGLRRRVSLPDLGLRSYVVAASGDTTPVSASASWTSPNASNDQLVEPSERGRVKMPTRRLSLPMSSRKP